VSHLRRSAVLALAVLAALLTPAAAAHAQDPACPPAKLTPDWAFGGTPPDYTYEVKYQTVAPCGYKMAYVESGPADGPVALLVHGNPTWGYYYRNAIKPLADAGYRVIVPDLVGFGRSDKIESREANSYENHEKWLRSFVTGLDLRKVNLKVHDWGGLLGLRVAAFDQDRFASVVAADTSLPYEGGDAPLLFQLWQTVAQITPWFSPVIDLQTVAPIPGETIGRWYDGPFPWWDFSYSNAPRQLPQEVPLDATDPDALRNREAVQRLKASYTKPFATIIAQPDEVTGNFLDELRDGVPGAANQAHPRIPNAQHYIQEDANDQIVDVMLRTFRR
jgi:haloalkane dehalogenase